MPGRVRSPKGSTQKYRYLMLARREGNAFSLIEYRTDLQGREEQPHKPIRGVLKSTGFAVTQLYFGPRQQPCSDFRYLGRQKIGGSPAEVVAFAEHVDPVAVMGRFSIGEASIPILSRVWPGFVAASTRSSGCGRTSSHLSRHSHG